MLIRHNAGVNKADNVKCWTIIEKIFGMDTRYSLTSAGKVQPWLATLKDV